MTRFKRLAKLKPRTGTRVNSSPDGLSALVECVFVTSGLMNSSFGQCLAYLHLVRFAVCVCFGRRVRSGVFDPRPCRSTSVETSAYR